jgi:hypothetical protein
MSMLFSFTCAMNFMVGGALLATFTRTRSIRTLVIGLANIAAGAFIIAVFV